MSSTPEWIRQQFRAIELESIVLMHTVNEPGGSHPQAYFSRRTGHRVTWFPELLAFVVQAGTHTRWIPLHGVKEWDPAGASAAQVAAPVEPAPPVLPQPIAPEVQAQPAEAPPKRVRGRSRKLIEASNPDGVRITPATDPTAELSLLQKLAARLEAAEAQLAKRDVSAAPLPTATVPQVGPLPQPRNGRNYSRADFPPVGT